jgi:hypothetical protein
MICPICDLLFAAGTPHPGCNMAEAPPMTDGSALEECEPIGSTAWGKI